MGRELEDETIGKTSFERDDEDTGVGVESGGIKEARGVEVTGTAALTLSLTVVAFDDVMGFSSCLVTDGVGISISDKLFIKNASVV